MPEVTILQNEHGCKSIDITYSIKDYKEQQYDKNFMRYVMFDLVVPKHLTCRFGETSNNRRFIYLSSKNNEELSAIYDDLKSIINNQKVVC